MNVRCNFWQGEAKHDTKVPSEPQRMHEFKTNQGMTRMNQLLTQKLQYASKGMPFYLYTSLVINMSHWTGNICVWFIENYSKAGQTLRCNLVR